MASVDVVIPSFQYGRYLRSCVESVLTQDVGDLRVLIIDNASTDGSPEIARRLAAEDGRVQALVRRRNLGPHASYNEGIDWATADYFLILCADDFLTPGSLRRAIGVLEREPDVHMAHGAAPLLADKEAAAATFDPLQPDVWDVIRGGAFREEICRTSRCTVLGPTTVVRTAVQKHVGYYRSSLPHTDDVEMWLRFTRHGDVAWTDAIQAVVRIHDTNRSSTLRSTHLWNLEMAAAFDSFFAFEGRLDPDGRRLHRMARRSLAARAYWGSLSSLLRGEPRLSRDLVTFALRHCPDMAVVPPLAALVRRGDARARIAAALAHAANPVRRRLSLARPR